MDTRVVGVLLDQQAEDLPGLLGRARSNQSRTPRQEQSRVVRRRLEKRLEHFRGLHKIVRQEIAHAEKLADEIVIRRRSKTAFKRRNGFGIKLRAIGSQAPVAVDAGEVRLPSRGPLEIFRGLRELG